MKDLLINRDFWSDIMTDKPIFKIVAATTSEKSGIVASTTPTTGTVTTSGRGMLMVDLATLAE